MENYQQTRKDNEKNVSIPMSTFNGLYNIRDMEKGDENFILSTFLRGLYYGDSWFSLIPKQIFMENYKPVILNLINGRAVIKVACLKEDPSIIIGYSILSPDFQTIHWVYCKEKWRRNGIGRSLVPKYPTAVSHLTALGKQLLLKFDSVIFNPFKL